MRLSIALAAVIGGSFAVPLPAAAQDLTRAWSYCTAQETPLDLRVAQCSAVIASDRVEDDGRALALTNRGVARAFKQDLAGAHADFEESLRLDPKGAMTYSYRAGLAIRAQDYSAALGDLDKAIALEPANANFLWTRGYVYSQLKDQPRAIADMTAAIALLPAPKQELVVRGIAYEENGEPAKAIADYQKVLEVDPDNEYARRALARLGGTPPASAALPPGDCSADVISHEGRVAACTAAIDAGKLTGWTLRTAYCNRGYALTELREYDRVIADSDALLAFDRNAACAHLNRGRAHYYQGALDRAIADYTQAVTLDARFHEANASRGTAYHEKRDFARAVADYDRAIGIDPTIAMYYKDRANSLQSMGELKRAVASISEAIELEPDTTELYRRRGDYQARLGDLDRAIADYGKAIELEPDRADTLHARARAYTAKGLNGLAEADREAADKAQFNRFQRLIGQPR